MARRRLDREMVRRGLADSRAQAAERIAARVVRVSGAVADKAARLVDPAEPIVVETPSRFVGRGARKLDAALDAFGIDVEDRVAVDVGSSTGGFTDCLLQRGARRVTAIDVGRGQLHGRLVADPRVRVLERTDVRSVTAEDLGDHADLAVVDVSFISVCGVIGPVMGLIGPHADLVVLVKPQFEVGRRDASRGRGVVRDPALWTRALTRVIGCCAAHDATVVAIEPSPLTGAAGNVEFLAHLQPRPDTTDDAATGALVHAAVSRVQAVDDR